MVSRERERDRKRGRGKVEYRQYCIFIDRKHWEKGLLGGGIVTGGQYHSNKGCQPYTIPKCSHHVRSPDYSNCTGEEHTPKCSAECESGYSVSYKKDVHYGASAYSVEGEKKIMTEIMTNGPVEGAFSVYADFPTYKSGTVRSGCKLSVYNMSVCI